jgi:hypothetical protein
MDKNKAIFKRKVNTYFSLIELIMILKIIIILYIGNLLEELEN